MTRPKTSSKAALERQRAHDRLMKRQARVAYLAERTALQDAYVTLTSRFYALRGTMLPWEEVATALREAREVADSDNRDLQQQVRQTRLFATRLHHWVSTMSAPTTTSLSSNVWTNVTLSHDIEMRQLGLEWIQKQLYHSASTHLTPSVFPHAYEDSVKVEWGCRGRKIVLQKVVQASPQIVAAALWAVNRASTGELFPGVHTANIRVLRETQETDRQLSYSVDETGNSKGTSLKICHARFHDGHDRILVAYRSVTIDDTYPDVLDPDEYLEWNEIRRISATTCLLRSVNYLQPRASFESVTDYVEGIYPAGYHHHLQQYSNLGNPNLSFEQYLQRALLMRGIAIAHEHSDILHKVIQSVVANPAFYSV
ncbi:hypothetical protein SDRG_05067 [Saprolegnia diclina VS20]|uniref:START domain-containing protein n=1 Tax=Saprolegnia diclina (strain VS20) TaxID=1156394 RepID=T0QHQ5_SAPDV|nr:hypothetical protein SDRG_05067 [Saprolegnia diclina VS20]EQC37464.1 hypothetical protein SDRG_05067 [Saprolegnia diclina VS20]|eukprot:XP_008608984.1 hypothetical protein SDRG_05067 [Saprolegnia diclina VS20]